MEDKYFYSTEVEWTAGRAGNLRAPVLPNLQVDAPPQFEGHDGRLDARASFCGGSQFMLHDYVHGDCRKF